MNFKRILTHVLLMLILSFQALFSFSKNDESKQPNESGIWIRNYPTISKGLTQVIIKVRLTQPGNVYYVFYDSPVEDITAFRIKSDAITQNDASIQKWGTINYPSVPGAVSITVDGFDREQPIYLYMVTESNNTGLIEDDVKSYQFSMHFKHRIVPLDSTTAPYGYLEYLPDNYYDKTIKNFPLILFLHGTGGTGNGHYDGLTNPQTCMREGLTRYLEMDMDLPAIVISPQTPSDWNSETVNSFVDFLIANYNINTYKISVTGISMGGGGVWRYAITHPEKISAVVPLCGTWTSNRSADFEKLANLPVWAFHNDQDPTVTVNNTYIDVNGIIKAGGHPFMSIFRSDDHSCAWEAYNYPGLWDWVLAQERGKGILEYGILNALKTNQPIHTDGLFNENCWNSIWSYFQSNMDVNNPDDPRFKMVWDQNYLYTGVSFNKETEFNNEKEVRIFLNGDEKVGGNYPMSSNFKSSDQSVSSNINTDGILSKWVETDSTINLEIAIPFSKTLRPEPITGDGFGFDIKIKEIKTILGTVRNVNWYIPVYHNPEKLIFGNILLSAETNDQITANQTRKSQSNLVLNQNFPNPFSQNSTICYFVPKRKWVTLKVYDSIGKEIKTLVNQTQNEGYHSVQVNGFDYKSGIYTYYLHEGKNRLSKKFAVIK